MSSPYINEARFEGNLLSDCAVATVGNDLTRVQFDVAIPKPYKDKATGETRYDKPVKVRVTWFGEWAERQSALLKSGRYVIVHARINYSQWEKDGLKRSMVDFVVEDNKVKVFEKRPMVLRGATSEDLRDSGLYDEDQKF